MVNQGNEHLRAYDVAEQKPEQLAAAQEEFGTLLESINLRETHRLPDLTEKISHRGTYTKDISKLFRGGFFLSQEMIEGVKNIGENLPEAYSFTPQSLLRLGREDSRRKVFFGSLNVEVADQSAQSLRVAVKPFEPKDRDTAFHECGMYQYISQKNLPTLRVLGVLVPPDKEGSMYALTHFNPSVISMDNVIWHELSVAEQEQRLGIALDALAVMHSNLLFHGDYEFKNVGYGERDGDAVIVDTELTVSARDLIGPEDTEAPVRLIQMMSKDFTDLCKSVNNFVFSTLPEKDRPKDDIALFKEQVRRIYGPYYERLQDQQPEYRTVLKDAYRSMLERKRRLAAGESISSL